jgi:Ca2+-binding RTX toxin-like protein
MPATMLSGLATTFQRAILGQLNDLGSQWLPSFDGTSITRTKLFGATVGQFEVIFSGTGLAETSGGLTGSVDRIDLFLVTGGFPRPKVAEITGLNIPDFDAFVTNANGLPPGEPDFGNPNVADFVNDVTPGVINGSDGADFFEWGTNPVTINAGKGDDVLLAGPGSGTINMGPGQKDAIDFRNVDSGLTLDMESGTATAGSSTYTFAGVTTFFGTDLADTLNGSETADRIFGRGGPDKINGLGGDDWLYGDDSDDVIRGGGGNDRLFGQAHRDLLYGGSDRDTLRGGDGVDKLYGGKHADKLYGDKGGDFLFGGSGQDTLRGGEGKDLLEGGIKGDKLFGGIGRDTLEGGRGNDTLFGGGGKDSLYGGRGNDILNGGEGKDSFFFEGNNLGNDRIVDFVRADDQIWIFDQTGTDVSITKSSTGNFTIAHDQGTIKVFDITDSFTIDDIIFL